MFESPCGRSNDDLEFRTGPQRDLAKVRAMIPSCKKLNWDLITTSCQKPWTPTRFRSGQSVQTISCGRSRLANLSRRSAGSLPRLSAEFHPEFSAGLLLAC